MIVNAPQGWPEYSRALHYPRDKRDQDLSEWIHLGNCIGQAPNGERDPERPIKVWYLRQDIDLIMELTRQSVYRENVLLLHRNEAGKEASRGRYSLRCSADAERDLLIFRAYLQQIPAGRGVWKRVSTLLLKAKAIAHKSEVLGENGKQSKIARSARIHYERQVHRQFDQTEAQLQSIAHQDALQQAARVVALRWGCTASAILTLLKKRSRTDGARNT